MILYPEVKPYHLPQKVVIPTTLTSLPPISGRIYYFIFFCEEVKNSLHIDVKLEGTGSIEIMHVPVGENLGA